MKTSNHCHKFSLKGKGSFAGKAKRTPRLDWERMAEIDWFAIMGMVGLVWAVVAEAIR